VSGGVRAPAPALQAPCRWRTPPLHRNNPDYAVPSGRRNPNLPRRPEGRQAVAADRQAILDAETRRRGENDGERLRRRLMRGPTPQAASGGSNAKPPEDSARDAALDWGGVPQINRETIRESLADTACLRSLRVRTRGRGSRRFSRSLCVFLRVFAAPRRNGIRPPTHSRIRTRINC
jgi:hypothetical protein